MNPASTWLSPLGLILPGVRRAVDVVLADFLCSKAQSAVDGRLPSEITQVLHEFVFAGGKRLRPLLCALGWHAARGSADIGPLIRTAASLEMFHAFALIHDDRSSTSPTKCRARDTGGRYRRPRRTPMSPSRRHRSSCAP
ncbi:polyprenyl synthetase family protein [Streptomyces sp. NPDC050636]|uniref:polyprenyl synthetase family protein n=1 Tax=Streptomyces sp. NPDC050636 TaxID=3154510 RepID=UPI00341264BE